jgi:hypothetical protein
MSQRIALPLFGLLLSAGCAADAMSDDVPGAGGKADSFLASELVVVANGTVCITAPCPSYTVMDANGAVSVAADVVLPEGVDQDAAFAALHDAGLRVTGAIDVGEWSHGQPGDVVLVQGVVAPVGRAAPFDNGIRCIAAPCPSVTLLHETGEFEQVDDIDLSMVELPEDVLDAMQGDLYGGRLLIGGFVLPGGPRIGDRFVVTTAVGVINDDYRVDGGIVCITTPCPSYIVSNSNGDPVDVDDLDLEALELPADELARVEQMIDDGAVRLRGFITSEGDVATLHVTKVLPDAE